MNPYFEDSLLPILLVFVFMIYLTFQLIKVASKIDLLDRPSARKLHKKEVPLVGGIAIFIAVTLCLTLVPFGLGEHRLLVFGIGILMVVGVLDDHQDISPKSKLFVQLVVAVITVYSGDMVVSSIGDIFNWRDGNEQGLGWLAQPLTVIAIVAVINAFNMLDGHDGVASCVFLVIAGALVILSAFSGDWKSQYILCLFFVATLVFLFFNMKWLVTAQHVVFLGDAGSMLLGFVIAYFLIDLSSGTTEAVKQTAVPWIIGVPLFDMASVILVRLKNRFSIADPDRRHIHHGLYNRGLSKNQVLSAIVLLQIGFCSIGLIGTLWVIHDWLLFWALFPTMGLYIYFRQFLFK